MKPYIKFTQAIILLLLILELLKKMLFSFRLQGEHFNGNKFAAIAIEKGAKYAVIDDVNYQIQGKTILVNNVLQTLQKLANYHRKQLNIPIIGITGSNGKTTTKELIHAVLATQFKTKATKGNLNNHIGVPLTLLSFTNKTEIGIVEMGANHQKEIEFLSSICEPDVGYITNFGKAHLEGFGGIEGVIKGKSELYTYLKKNNKLAFIGTIKRGAIFFSLQGDHFNGNKFAATAIQKGAKYAVIDDANYQIEGKTIVVDNVLETLQKLANYHRKQLKIPIIGITGSNGKTTTKELIHNVLATQFKTKATKGNLNNHIGVPLTLLSFTNKTEIGIVEMGANHQKEIEFLSSICEPDVGYITNFGKAHLEGFGGIEGVIKGKSELYTYLKNNNKIAFIDAKDAKQLELTKTIDSISLNSAVTISSSHPLLSLNYNNEIINTQLIGAYNLNNLKAAIAIGEYYKVSKKNIITGISNYKPTNNRSQVIKKKSNTIVMDAYNANPSSTRLALENFNEINHDQKIVILGDMFELGAASEKEHQNIVDLCDTLNLNRCVFVGKHYSKTSAVEKYLTVASLKESITTTPLEKSYILIKGSRGMSLEQLLECIN